ncbi:MAG: protein translocase subunit SecD [Patescibacteria group bacterium]
MVEAIGFGPKFSDEDYKLGLDLQGGAHLVYEADMSNIPSGDRSSALEGVRDVIERRVDAFGVAEPLVQTNVSGNTYRIIIELAGVFDISEAIAEIGETPILEFKLPVDSYDEAQASEEQQAEIVVAQEQELIEAEAMLERARGDEDFGALATEFSLDPVTSANNGYVGWVSEDSPIYGDLVTKIEEEKLKTGVLKELYQGPSSIHVIEYLDSRKQELARASHILICHEDSESCESDRSKIEAQLLAEEIQREVNEDNFGETAREKSEGPTAAVDGDLGVVHPETMVEPFEDALFALDDGEISEVIETQFGYHIIYRMGTEYQKEYEIAHIEMPWTTLEDISGDGAWQNTELSGKHIKSAAVAFDPNTGVPYVSLNFNSEGGDLFSALTEEHVGDVIGIFLDGIPISTPVVQQAIYGGEASITGQFTIEEARLLSQRLNAGALPVPIELVSQQTVGPTLGAISLERSINAAMIGFLLVALFMIIYYRLAGFFAVLALLVYAAVNLALYKWLGVTMTLAGIAGFILSLGMAVDANVLIFERLKEELKSGRDLPTAIDEGFRRAWTSIRDGNLTTMIAAAVLFSMATSFIKGFALTLGIGILVSMLTAIFVTRILLQWFGGWKWFSKKWLYNGPKKNKEEKS